jgi:DNA polymerase I-like protein with 3'-5' exonuclease and polymerase domains
MYKLSDMIQTILEKPTLREAYKLLHQGSLALARTERQGIRVDMEYIKNKKEFLTKEVAEEEEKLRKTEFYKEWKKSRGGEEPNYQSQPQLKEFLYKVKGYEPPKYTPKGKQELKEQGSSDKGSTDEEALKALNIKALNKILRIKKLKKARDTYLENLEREAVDGYVHPFFNLHLARTYRGSSSMPASQTLPKRNENFARIVRTAIIPRDGNMLVEADFKSLEIIGAACVSQDPNLLNYLRSGGDMHKDIAKELFFVPDDKTGEEGFSYLRSCVKNAFVFPQFYGSYYFNNARNVCKWLQLPQKRFAPGKGVKFGEGTIADHLRSVRTGRFPKGVRNFDDLVRHIEDMEQDLWVNRFPTHARWKQKIWEEYRKKGYIESLTGFRFSGLMEPKDTYNYPIQSICFHILLKSLIKADFKMEVEKWNTKIIGQIHDSLFLDVPPNEFDYVIDTIHRITTKRIPNEWPWIIVPLNIDFEASEIDGSWADMYKVKN